MLSVRHIELLRALASHRHFGRAAASLGISQPALTRSLKHVEEGLGVPIFDRDGVTPTLFGSILLRHGERILAEHADMMRELTLARGLEIGELQIAAGPYLADISVQQAIGRLSASHPRVFIRLAILDWTDATEAVLEGRADIAVAEISEAAGFADLETELVSTAQMWFFCAASHPLAGRSAPTLGDLLEFPWVGPTAPGRMRAALPQTEGAFGTFDPPRDRLLPRITVETFTAARDIVTSGLGLAVATPRQIEAEVQAGRLVRLPVNLPWMRLNYGFITRRGRSRSPAAEAFIAMVREIEREQAVPRLA